MQIGIIGAGAVGLVLAASLHRAGHTVELVARGATLDAIRRDGVRMSGAWGDHVAAVSASDSIAHRPELALLTTKAHDAETALRTSADRLGGVPLLVVQNGLDGLSIARRVLQDPPLVVGLAMFASSLVAPGVARVTTPGATWLGSDDVAALAFVTGAIGTAFPIDVKRDLLHAQWSKLVFNQVNALPAITGLSVQQVAAHRGLARLLAAGMTESVRVARSHGARLVPMAGIPAWVLGALPLLPASLAALVPRTIARGMGDVPNPGSTLQSIRRGVSTEIDHLNGAVVRESRGVPTPVNALLVELVHEVERTGTFLTPADVLRRAAR